MNKIEFSQQIQYKITVEYSKDLIPITVAGFLASEQTEGLLCRHLSNLCLQSDGSFLYTQMLIAKLMLQWRDSFSMNATQTLRVGSCTDKQNIQTVCLYKIQLNGKEQLINKIQF